MRLKNSRKNFQFQIGAFYRAVFIIVLALLQATCKQRRESELQDFSVRDDANHDFYITVRAELDKLCKSTRQETMRYETMRYVEPVNGRYFVNISYSPCWRVIIEQKSKNLDESIVIRRNSVAAFSLYYDAKKLYCPDGKCANTDKRRLEDHAWAMAGYFFHAALGKEMPFKELEPFSFVKNIQPLIIDQTKLKTAKSYKELEYSDQSNEYKMPVTSMLSGLASYYFYDEDKRLYNEGWFALARNDLEDVVLRQLVAEKKGFVGATKSGDEVLAMPSICYRRINNSCLKFRCTEDERTRLEKNFNNEYRMCRPGAVELLTVLLAGPIIMLDGAIGIAGAMTYSQMTELEREEFSKAFQNMLDSQRDLVNDPGGRNIIHVNVPWDYQTIEKLLVKFDIHKPYGKKGPSPN